MKKVLLSAIFLLFGFTLLSAQNQNESRGQIQGTVTDSQTGETLIGVNVTIQGTSIGSATDIDGDYTIRRVPVGSHVLVVSYLGYERVEMDIEVTSGETVTTDVTLSPSSVEGEEVIIGAQREGQQQAINRQITSERIVNVVSEAKIQELPDFNAAAALGRLPGVSTTKSSGEDNKVVIRGLSPEYNSIEIEGTRMSSTGSPSIGFTSDVYVNTGGVSNDRSVDLTSVSPYMVRMMSVYKSLTPDMNANSIGGTVNMELREAPSDPRFDALLQGGYTAKSNEYGNYRAVISGSNRFFNDKLGAYALLNIESYDRFSDNLNAGYGTRAGSAEADSVTGFRPVQVNSVTFNRHVETRDRYGANLILDYKLPNGSLKFVNMLARANSDYTDYDQTIGYNNGRMNWRLQEGDNIKDQQLHSLKFYYDFEWMNVSLSTSYTSATNILDDSPVINFNQTSAVKIDDERVNQKPEEILDFQNQFQGVDRIILRTGNLFSSDYKENKWTHKADFDIPFNIGVNLNGSFKFGGQLDMQSNSLDQESPYMEFNGNANSADPGASIADSLMVELRDRFGLVPNSTGEFTGPDFVNSNNDLFDPFLNDRYGGFNFIPDPGILTDAMSHVIGNPVFDASNQGSVLSPSGRNGGWYDGPYQQLINDYSFDEDYYATYAMAQFNFSKFFFIGGVRYEKVESNYLAYNARDIRNVQNQVMVDTTATSGNEQFLPMSQVKYSPFEWMDIRYAYTHTLARPSYHQLSPKYNISNDGNNVSAGNPNLKPAKAFNHDLNLTFHTNRLGLFSVGGFYKTIEGFVYNARYALDVAEEYGIDNISNYQIPCSQGIRDRYELTDNDCPDGTNLFQPSTSGVVYASKPLNNPHDATVKGIEVDFQHNLWYLPAPLDGAVFGINYTRIASEYIQPYYLREQIPGSRPPEFVMRDSTFTGRLVNQSNHVLNTYIGYDYKGFSGRFSLLFQANSWRGGGGEYPENDEFTRDYLKLDFSARQKLPFDSFNSELFMDVSNLNSANTNVIQRSIRGTSSVENYGITANLGIRLRY